MAPAVRSLGLYDLLAPEFLAGFSFPSYIDQYLSLLSVSGLTMTSDDSGVLYTGTVYFPTGGNNSAPVTQHNDPSGAVFEWSDVNFQFRLRVWREGSSDLQSVVNAISSGSGNLQALFNGFGSVASNSSTTASEYPGLSFRLELLLSLLTFHLGKDWVPGKMDSSYHVVPDTTTKSDVRILLPKMLLRYEQSENFSQAPRMRVLLRSKIGLCAPLSTLRRCPREHLRMTRGRCGSLLLHRDGLEPSTPCRSPDALRFPPDCVAKLKNERAGKYRNLPVAMGFRRYDTLRRPYKGSRSEIRLIM